ncbi:hypothetical protein [Paraburkholderia sp. GAS32]|uniref:hypothetical protein n=1 Tax=Paraburkholderia sp. GAS32 TaxID=3035129 RepID=UPI003D2520F1
MNTQEMVAEIESFAKEPVEEQFQKHQCWLEDQKAAEAHLLINIGRWVYACATLLDVMLDNPHDCRKVMLRKAGTRKRRFGVTA